jgi:signal transduction histidine kinase
MRKKKIMEANKDNIFLKAVSFIKENLNIIYSLFLLVLIPAAFLINNYLINSNYEQAIDRITYRNGALAESIINSLISNQDTASLQSSIDRIIKNNGEIVSLSILSPQSQQGEYQIIASNNQELIGKTNTSTQDLLAWNNPEGIAFLDRNEGGRFWKVVKTLRDDSGKKFGLIEISFSLNETDSVINKVISNSYWILILTILIVVLFVANQARFMGYAFTVTKLKEIDKMKDMFISMASHELRSPLAAIKGYVDLLETDKDLSLDKDSTRYLGNISLSVRRLDDLVEDVLEVSRIEGNHLPMEIKVFDPHPVISQSIEEMRSQAMQKNLILNYKPVGLPLQIRADEGRLKQVVINFISNAIKYTEKGQVDVTTSIKKDDFLITVADTGMGISSEDQSKLFQKFYRIKNEKTADIIGTGLGLWITSEIVKMMKGRITIESIEGVGSHFTVHIPLYKK